jgi:importin subunit alpha-1
MSGRQRQERKEQYKKALDFSQVHEKRVESTISLRRNKREESFAKKRNVGAVVFEKRTVDASVIQKLEELPNLVAQVQSNDPVAQVEATTQFRKLLSIGMTWIYFLFNLARIMWCAFCVF